MTIETKSVKQPENKAAARITCVAQANEALDLCLKALEDYKTDEKIIIAYRKLERAKQFLGLAK